MSKLYKSLGCPYCYSHNITATLRSSDERVEHCNYLNSTYPVEKRTRKRVFKCKCEECGKTYSVDHGNDIYIKFEAPYPLDNSKNIELLAIYNSDSDRNYKIISVDDSYMILYEDNELAINVKKEDVDELLVNNESVNRLVYTKLRNRNN